jgi:Polyketide cyclase / dehydrase and lipid transport
MARFTRSVCIHAPVGEVWERLARLEDIQLWSEAVTAARCDGAVSRGVGAQRTCKLVGGVTITERWLQWEEGRSLTYEGVGVPLVAMASNRWTVHPAGERTVLTSTADVSLEGGLLLAPLVGPLFDRMATRTLAAFEHLVEHGEPPPGKHNNLPAAPAVC